MLSGISLFIGVESQNWQLSDFQTAARAVKALGVSNLLIKIADGTHEWYGNIGGWGKVLDAVAAEGIKAVPYMYCYGNKYGGLLSEIAILKDVMGTEGIVVADMEAEWNGQTTWGAAVASALKDHTGQFGVTTWADPNLQNWNGVLQAIKPCVDFWMPQVYSDNLASMYQGQYAGLLTVPVFNLGTDYGSNDLLAIVKTVLGQPVAFWEYQAAIAAYATIMKEIIALFPNQGGTDMLQITDPFADTHFTAISPTTWHCINTGIDIHDAILYYWRKTQGAFRLPRTGEIYGVIDGGSLQVFEAGVLVWDPKRSFDNPGFGDVYAAHVDQNNAALHQLLTVAGLGTLGTSVLPLQPVPAKTA